jgi:hypothetical protein
MTDTQTVEQVARAIHEAYVNAPYSWWHVDAEQCRLAPHLARAALSALSDLSRLEGAAKAELERQCSIGAGDFEVCPDSGLWNVNMHLDAGSFLRALANNTSGQESGDGA